MDFRPRDPTCWLGCCALSGSLPARSKGLMGRPFPRSADSQSPRGASVPSLWLQQPGVARRPAGHGCPTGTLRFSQQTRPDYRPNSRGLAPGTTLTGPCPAALRTPTCRLHSPPFLAPKRRQPDATCRKSQARVRAGARKVAEGGGKCRLCVPQEAGRVASPACWLPRLQPPHLICATLNLS